MGNFFSFINSISFIKIIGFVVQSVRAPPCHGGSCGFESRQVRRKNNCISGFAIFKKYSKKMV